MTFSSMDLFRPHQPSSSGNQGDIPSTSQGHEELVSPSSSVLFREIHKNAWLRKLPSLEKRAGTAPKKGERVWAVFCVHDDVHPFLELYMEQKMAAAHKPDWCVSLSSTLHVSPTIVAHDQEYEFVITLPSDIVRLTAPSWEMMMEWVDTIRSKLREMRILCPRENVYSRMPEPRMPLLPTRDPNSPLPPPPLGPSALVPGVEPVHLDTADTLLSSSSPSTSQNTNAGPSHSSTPSRSNPPVPVLAVASSSQGDGRPRHRTRSSSLSESRAAPLASSPRSPGLNCSSSRPTAAISTPRNAIVNRHPVSPSPISHRLSPSLRNQSTNGNGVDPPLSPAAIQSTSSSSTPSARSLRSPLPQTSSSASSHARSPGLNNSGNHNVTVIEVADSQRTPSDIFNFNFVRDALPQPNSEVEPLEQFFTPPITPRSRASIAHPPQTDQLTATTSPPSRLWQQITQVVSNLIGQPAQSEVIRVTQGVTNITIPSHQETASESQSHNMNVYEHVYPLAGSDTVAPSLVGSSAPGGTSGLGGQVVPVAPIGPSGPEESRARGPSATVAAGRLEVGEHQQRRRRTSSGSEILSPRSRSAANVSRHAAVGDAERRLHPVPHPFRQTPPGGEQGTGIAHRVTLRDQQVQQLRKEKLHPGGVRLQVRRKDCTNSIAFIDAFGAVWIAGWKQREHPMLYNALHIGDQLLSVAGLAVQSASDAHRFIRASNSLYVPFIIRRVPFGHVFAFRRDAEGQALGITLENGTAEVKEVVADSPAARGGLPSRAPTCDGLSLTPWVITEINGRPLNLFFKDGEVRDRLNAVGKEISVLVQPFDLIKQIKKHLKTIRGYKQFIVQ